MVSQFQSFDSWRPAQPRSGIFLTHEPVLAQPREGSLHFPTLRGEKATTSWKQLLPVYLSALLRPLLASALVIGVHPQVSETWKALAGGL